VNAEHGNRLIAVLSVAATSVVLITIIAFKRGQTPHLLTTVVITLVPFAYIVSNIRKGTK